MALPESPKPDWTPLSLSFGDLSRLSLCLESRSFSHWPRTLACKESTFQICIPCDSQGTQFLRTKVDGEGEVASPGSHSK